MKRLITIMMMCMTLIFLLFITFTDEEEALSFTPQAHSTHLPNNKIFTEDLPLLNTISIRKLQTKVQQLSVQDYPPSKEWGLNVTGVKTNLDTDKPIVALTFDACGSANGNGYDQHLITYLIEQEIPATLFINERWITENQQTFIELATQDLFQIENHGTHHKPLSMNGREAYGIQGTTSSEEVINEVLTNYQTIYRLTGKQTKYFRSGTAHYDETAVSLLNELGMKVVNFDINGDAGATFSAEQVKQSLLQAQPGSIALLHMNQPDSGTAEGVAMAIPLLQENGFDFVKLEDYQLK